MANPAMNSVFADEGLSSHTEGLCSVICGDTLLVHGGWRSDTVWELSLPFLEWSERLCRGHVPPSRLHHAAAMFHSHVLMCGGDTLAPASPAEASGPLPYYELSLATSEWSKMDTYGHVPLNRSHHTVTLVGDNLVLVGGKPTMVPGRPMSAGVLLEADRYGFYDLFVLNINTRMWRRVACGHDAPKVWGHSACLLPTLQLCVFGGLDITAALRTINIDGPPEADFNSAVIVLSLDSFSVSRHVPLVGNTAAPRLRAQHNAVAYGQEMIVFGGFTIDQRSGRPVNVNDCWVWDAGRGGEWRPMEFCLPTWPCAKLLCAVHGDQLVVVRKLSAVHVLDLTGHEEVGAWRKMNAIVRAHRSPFDVKNFEAVKKYATIPVTKPLRAPQAAAGAVIDAEVRALTHEASQLRSEQETRRAVSPVEAPLTTSPDSLPISPQALSAYRKRGLASATVPQSPKDTATTPMASTYGSASFGRGGGVSSNNTPTAIDVRPLPTPQSSRERLAQLIDSTPPSMKSPPPATPAATQQRSPTAPISNNAAAVSASPARETPLERLVLSTSGDADVVAAGYGASQQDESDANLPPPLLKFKERREQRKETIRQRKERLDELQARLDSLASPGSNSNAAASPTHQAFDIALSQLPSLRALHEERSGSVRPYDPSSPDETSPRPPSSSRNARVRITGVTQSPQRPLMSPLSGAAGPLGGGSAVARYRDALHLALDSPKPSIKTSPWKS